MEEKANDLSELARLILESMAIFPKEFLESFCLPHDCFKDKGYSPGAETIASVKHSFKSLAGKYGLSDEEMRLITKWDSPDCCSNPVMQLVRRWLQEKKPGWKVKDVMVWKKKELILVDFSDSTFDAEVAEAIFGESEG